MTHPQPRKKSSTTWLWIIFGCLGMVFVLMILAGVGIYFLVKSVMITDPVKVEEVAHRILPFEKPEGMKGVVGFSVLGVEGAMLATDGDTEKGLTIFLMRYPADEENREESERRRQELLDDEDSKVVDVQRDLSFRLRGEEVKAVRQVSEDKKGRRRVQFSMTLSGKKVTELVFAGPEADVDQARIQAILDTVR